MASRKQSPKTSEGSTASGTQHPEKPPHEDELQQNISRLISQELTQKMFVSVARPLSQHVRGGLRPEEVQQIRELFNSRPTLELHDPDTSERKKGKKGEPFEVRFEGSSKIFDFGMFRCEIEESGKITWLRVDGSPVQEIKPTALTDDVDTETIRQAIKVWNNLSANPSRRKTGMDLLLVWSLLAIVEQWWSTQDVQVPPVNFHNDTGKVTGSLSLPSGRDLFTVDVIAKLAKVYGVLLERFRLQVQEKHALDGQKQEQARSKAGKARVKAYRQSPRGQKQQKRLEQFQKLEAAHTDFKKSDAYREMARKELCDEGIVNPDWNLITERIKEIRQGINSAKRSQPKNK